MKTKYIKIFTIITALVTLSACSDFFDVKPEGQIILGDFWKSESDVEAVVATCYKELLSETNISKFIVWGELRSDNLKEGILNNDHENERLILESNILPTNKFASWASLYSTINYCNSVLHYAPQVIDPNFTQRELEARMAEVLTLRALAYFYLVRAFKDVPLILEPSLSDVQDYNVAQSKENEILDQLEKDLLKAEGWAMTVYGKKAHNKGRITKNAVRALLADVYLWRNKYTESIVYCDKVISNPDLELIVADEEPYFEIFGMQNSTESIFELQFTRFGLEDNSAVFKYYGERKSTSESTLGQFSAPLYMAENNSVFINTPTLTDVRRKDFINEKKIDGGYYSIFKYTGLRRYEFSNGTSAYNYRSSSYDSPNWIFYRLTDVILMKAEALSQLYRNDADKSLAIHLVNQVYMRSNPTLTDTLAIENFSSKKELEELVMLERQRELMFEGKRWFDLVRIARRDGNTKRLVEAVKRKSELNSSVISSKLVDMNAMYMPVHVDELKANKNLKQNPFYLTDIY